MTTYQSMFDWYLAYKAQASLGTPASSTGANILRVAGGTPSKLTKTAIESKEIRRDAQKTRGRHGFQKTTGGPFDVEASVGCCDDIYQALLRGTWDSAITKTSSDFTTIAIASNVLTLASGNPITLGFRVGDVIEMTGGAVPGNNSRNLRIIAINATTITVAETLTDHAADAGITLIRRGRKVIMPAAGSLVSTYFTVEEYNVDIDQSTLLSDCFWDTGKWSMAPDGMLMFNPSFIGTGDITAETTGISPVFTTPATPTGSPLAVLDATVRLGSTDLANLTSFDLTVSNGAVAPQIIAAKKSPTVLPGQNTVSMNLKMLRTDLSNLTSFIDETGFSLHVLAVENMAEPKNFFSLNVPFFTLGSVDPASPSTAGGALEETISIPAALIGSDTTGAGYDATMMSIQISNVS